MDDVFVSVQTTLMKMAGTHLAVQAWNRERKYKYTTLMAISLSNSYSQSLESSYEAV